MPAGDRMLKSQGLKRAFFCEIFLLGRGFCAKPGIGNEKICHSFLLRKSNIIALFAFNKVIKARKNTPYPFFLPTFANQFQKTP